MPMVGALQMVKQRVLKKRMTPSGITDSQSGRACAREKYGQSIRSGSQRCEDHNGAEDVDNMASLRPKAKTGQDARSINDGIQFEMNRQRERGGRRDEFASFQLSKRVDDHQSDERLGIASC